MSTYPREKPDLRLSELWNLSFGFLGVQVAYALQGANISRIFATLGADPHSLGYFWVLPPLMGIIVQPMVGTLSDRTWCRFGRRIPYLFAGALVAVTVMCLLPNAGSLGMAASAAMAFGLLSLVFLDTSINVAMQPFKMLVGDMVNERQKALAYSIQSFLCNAGALVGYVFPFLLTFLGIGNVAARGVVPDSVVYSFYAGAIALILCVAYTVAKVREMPPGEYARHHGLDASHGREEAGVVRLLARAPAAFWRVGLVQLFCWAAFLYMWNYTNGAIAETCWNTTDPSSGAFQEAGNWVGVLFAVQAVGSVAWAAVLPRIPGRRLAYSASLALGAAGFAMMPFVHDKYALFLPFLLTGCAWAAMLAMPFTIVTNALDGGHMGAYLGLFNGTICIPQILAALLGGSVLTLVGSAQNRMMAVSGALLAVGALCVWMVRETGGGAATGRQG